MASLFENMARNMAPVTTAREDEEARRNAELEAPPTPSAPAEASPWRMGPGGIQSRINPKRGVIEYIQNKNGDVADWTEPYTPPPVDEKRSYAELLLVDIPKRIEMVNRHLEAGNIPEAQAERDAIDKFRASTTEDLYKFTRYSGKDPITLEASKRAASLVSGSWLDPEHAMLFEPKNNPKARKSWGMKQGATASLVSRLEAADQGDPESVDIMQRINAMTGESVSAATTKKENVRSNMQQAYGDPVAAGIAADMVPQPEGYVSVGNKFNEYYDSVKPLILADMPDGTAGNTGIAEILQPLFQAHDADVFGNGLARLVPEYAGVSSTDSPAMARGKLTAASKRLAGYTRLMGQDSDQQRHLIPVLNGIKEALGTTPMASQDAVIRGVIETGIRPILDAASASGDNIDPSALTALAKAEAARRTGRQSDVPPAIIAGLSRLDQRMSDANLRITSPVEGPAPVSLDERGRPVMQETDADAAYPGFLAQKRGLQSAALRAKLLLASDPSLSSDDAFRRFAVPAMREAYTLQSSDSPEKIASAAEVAVTYMESKKGGVDLRTLKDDMIRDWGPTANQMSIMNAKEVLVTGTKRDSQDLYTAEKKQVDQWAKQSRIDQANNYDEKLYNVFNGSKAIPAGDFDLKPGHVAWNYVVKGARTVVGEMTRTSAVGDGTGMTLLLAGTPISALVDPSKREALVSGLADSFYRDLTAKSAKISGKVPVELGRALSRSFAEQVVASAVENTKVKENLSSAQTRDTPVAKLFSSATEMMGSILETKRDLGKGEKLSYPAKLGYSAAPGLGDAGFGGPASETSGFVTSAQDALDAVSGAYMAAILSEAVGGEGGLRPARNAGASTSLKVIGGTAAAAAGTASGIAIASSSATSAAALNASLATFLSYSSVATPVVTGASAVPLGLGAAGSVAPWVAPSSLLVPGLGVATAGTGVLAPALVGGGLVTAAAVAALGAGYMIYNANLEDIQPVDEANLSGRLGRYATVFAGAEQVKDVPAATKTQGPVKLTPLPAYPSGSLTLEGFSEAGKAALAEVPQVSMQSPENRAERARLKGLSAQTGGLVNAPVDLLKPGDTLAKAINTISEVSRNNTRATEHAAAPAIFAGVKERLKGVDPEVAATAEVVIGNMLAKFPDITYREAQQLASDIATEAHQRHATKQVASYSQKRAIDDALKLSFKEKELKLEAKYGKSGEGTPSLSQAGQEELPEGVEK